MEKPSLTFFCELDSHNLYRLFSDKKTIDSLVKLNANLSLGLLDFSPKRAEVVKKLNHAGIPVTAWILLPKEQGYWTSLDTIVETTQRYLDFKTWATKNNLIFAAVGLDIEPKLEIVKTLAINPWSQILSLLKRLFPNTQFRSCEADARTLIQIIHADGYPIETYQFPTVIDERNAKSIVLAKTLGLPSLQVDREVLMLYTSFFPKYKDSILWSYAKQCQAIGVGSTGGGVNIEGIPPLKPLRWIDLKRDLLLSAQNVKDIYIFSLEGCVNNKIMGRLADLDWNTRVIPPYRTAAGITLIRRIGQGFLWVFSHPLEFLLCLVIWTQILKKKSKAQ